LMIYLINGCSVTKCARSKIVDPGSYQNVIGRNGAIRFELNALI
jgi:hypothetical protein